MSKLLHLHKTLKFNAPKKTAASMYHLSFQLPIKKLMIMLPSHGQNTAAVKIILHIYDNNEACHCMNKALTDLSKLYDDVKFCAVAVGSVGMSKEFKINGVPALLVYKGGQVVGNFVGLKNELGSYFEMDDVQTYLIEHGMLEDKSCTPSIIKNGVENSDDSD